MLQCEINKKTQFMRQQILINNKFHMKIARINFQLMTSKCKVLNVQNRKQYSNNLNEAEKTGVEAFTLHHIS